MGVLENTILSLSYLQSLNEKYVFFSPLGITSIHSRWIENKKDAECSVEIWKNIKQLYAFGNKHPQLKNPSSKIYNVVKEVVDDRFNIVKLQKLNDCFKTLL